MWPLDSIDLKNTDLLLDHQRIVKTDPRFELKPYKFTVFENGKRTVADSSSLNAPSWLLLDHSIAVIWSMFNLNSALQLLSIDDLKWAYEFLRRIKNKKGENPPDVKVCLKKIQDRLIHLYAKLTSLREGEDLDKYTAAFDEKVVDSTSNYLNTTFTDKQVDSKFDTMSLSPCKNSLSLVQKHSSNDIAKAGIEKKMVNSSKEPYSFLQNSDDEAGTGSVEDDEVEKYVLSFFKDEKKEFTNTKRIRQQTYRVEEIFQEPWKHKGLYIWKKPGKGGGASESLADCSTSKRRRCYKCPSSSNNKYNDYCKECNKRLYVRSIGLHYVLTAHNVWQGAKSLIPTKKKTDAISTQETNCEQMKKDGQSSKRVHCVAEMRSLKFQKSMKVKDTNGEEAAYSNLKAEIQRLTINPKVSKNEVMKFLKDWRSEQVDRLHNELKRLSSIEEFMKNLNNDEVETNLRMNSHFGLTELDTEKIIYGAKVCSHKTNQNFC